jgi:hypothetical protein
LILWLALFGVVVMGGISASTHGSYACDPSPCPRPNGGGK